MISQPFVAFISFASVNGQKCPNHIVSSDVCVWFLCVVPSHDYL